MFSFASCISTKKVTYFNNLPDSAKIQLDSLRPSPFLVQVNDALEIDIGGENEKTVQYIKQYFTSGNSGLQAIVDIDGNIELPKIGKLHVGGLSKEEVKNIITHAYKEYLVDPLIDVRFGNFRFSVLGEVKAPGNFNVASEKVNIFEAVATAGDLTQYARKGNVKIIREVNGSREIISINMNDKSILNSPNYYLTRYDIIYVESSGTKLNTENAQRATAYVATATSLVAILLTIFR